jgi:hypothetical protein
MCPTCGQDAPLVYKSVLAFCSACGKPRIPLSASAVNFRGKPATIGGTVAAVAGWLLLFGTLAVALTVGAVLQAIFPVGAVVGWIVGGVIAVAGVVTSLLLLFGGRALRRSGTNASRAARLDALNTLAAYQRGVVTAQMASESLGLSLDQADAFLTSLAKQPDSGVTLEVDEDGKITYCFANHARPLAWGAGTKMRVDARPDAGGDARVVGAASVEPEVARVDEVAANARHGRHGRS